jgi:uncharacterized protein (DUF433 family)
MEVSHFDREIFFTDGRRLYLQLSDHEGSLLELLSGGQWVIAPAIRELAAQIEFSGPCGTARRWYPMGVNGLVVLDPSVSFGRPSIVGRGTSTAVVYDLYKAEKETEAVAKWLNLQPGEVKAAVAFETQLVA